MNVTNWIEGWPDGTLSPPLTVGADSLETAAGSSLPVRGCVSHSGELGEYAFSRAREIGVDVEAVRLINDADAITATFFTP